MALGASVRPVPDEGEDVAHCIPDEGGDDDERHSRGEAEWLHDVWVRDHVPAAEERAERAAYPRRIEMVHTSQSVSTNPFIIAHPGQALAWPGCITGQPISPRRQRAARCRR